MTKDKLLERYGSEVEDDFMVHQNYTEQQLLNHIKDSRKNIPINILGEIIKTALSNEELVALKSSL